MVVAHARTKPPRESLGEGEQCSDSQRHKVAGVGEYEKGKSQAAQAPRPHRQYPAEALQKLTPNLTRRFHPIVIEDLNGHEKLKSHPLIRSIADRSFFDSGSNWNTRRNGGLVGVADC
ncbi:hypothetical protein A7K93_01800 [Candidatus Methylacidiphilum fumarolicum]|uniref:Uncharacterized protein n=2 Tax=Candidatus Methylacidiphilum fumarolicum TaxID=591154 RepID=I0JVP9_METFB|nr:hypothetical protein [Candidatus Methylacidiphilum fumarolicum]MBW6414068.1 hypothetical protein [Candidatus Methylacidiphilum fumarolicum]TFE66417.1 hypothetical protein A7K73_01535 [Candidatus Methylacidiphilum fumarolicum]TFE75246.1 hypothetical protein A7K93_01800 [Candidatus Methylacidiphilum fumarolicum]TFE76142.1 hypothetical protein A7K72_00375 [Candidatus Methylacidiphilum fumarolicum]TFE77290.1 hypothetical protein A7D33_05650 [Candidatus Methylacidiphilum fumarolicum]